MGLERRVTLYSLLWFPHPPPPPSNVILGVPTSTQTRTLCAQKVSWKRPRIQYHFLSILDPISDDFSEKNSARLIYLSSSVSKLIFASNSLDPSVVEKSKNLQNTWTVVQKSTLRISELIEKYDLPSVRIWYQNLLFLDQNSIPKVHLTQTSSIEAVLVSDVSQNNTKKDPKMLGRNWQNRPWDPFGQIKQVSWSQRHLHSSSSSSFWPHMEAT